MTSGGKKPPRPPAAPTTPVTAPTLRRDHSGDEGEHGAGSGAERGGHAEERDGADGHQRELERDDRGEGCDDAEGGDENGDRAQPVGEPPADGAHRDGEHDEPGGAQRGVGAVEVVGGGQVGGQVDAEGDEPAERDRVQEGQLPGRGHPQGAREPLQQAAGGDLAVGAVAQRDVGHDGVDDQDGGDEVEGEAGPNALLSCTVVKAEMAVPPMPAPKVPSASPRRAGGYQEFTKGMPMANVVPPRPRKKPPIR